MYRRILEFLKEKPVLYAPSTVPFWDGEHISKGMLQAHLTPDIDGASRKHDFIEKSVRWIARDCGIKSGAKLLDLGCGPGMYTERFYREGFCVTGIDFSKRSIQYAASRAATEGMSIDYIYKNYLNIDFEDVFDIITLIYCDFGVLSPENRTVLLNKIRKALKPGGILILDGFTPRELDSFHQGRTIQYCGQGFWSPEPHMCIQSNILYPETGNYLEQYIIVTENDCQCYNNWNQVFTAESLKTELKDAGVKYIDLYDNAAGKTFTGLSSTICAVAAFS